MSKSRAYSAVGVQSVSMESLLAERPVGEVWAGVDVGKDECMMVLRWQDGSFERPIRRGRRELEAELADRPTDRVRLPGGGRPLAGKKTPLWNRR